MFKATVYTACLALLITIIATLVKSNDKKKSTRTFLLVTLSMVLWLVALGIADFAINKGTALYFINLAIFFFSIVTWLLLYFALQFKSEDSKKYISYIAIGVVYNLLFLVFANLEIIIKGVSLGKYGTSITSSSFIYDFHTIQANFFAVAAIIILNFKRKHLESSSKKQVSLMTTGLLVAIIGNALSGIVANYSQSLSWLYPVGTLSTSLFIVIIGYAIIKYKLFDIRLVVARSVAYILSLSSLVTLYAILVVSISTLMLGDEAISVRYRIINVVVAVLLAVTFPWLKHFFDKLTNRIFFREAYDTQTFIGDLNKAIVNNLDLHSLLKDTSTVIANNLKSEWCALGIKETDFSGRRVVGTTNKSFKTEDVSEVRRLTPKLENNVVVADDLSDEQSELKQLLNKNDVALLARLAPDGHSTKEGAGYLLLGHKKSGNAYSSMDREIVAIVAHELLIAIENALRFEEIEQFNITLQRKVDSATRNLRRANERLKQLDDTKDDFISMASHQLRTPLTSVKGYISMLQDGDAGKVNTTQRKMLGQAFVSSQRMVYLISDLLNVSRLKTGKFAIDPAPIDLSEVIASEIEQLKDATKNKNIKLLYSKPKGIPKLMLDDMKTRQVLMNFIDNAIYYTPEGGKIEVKLTHTNNAVEVRVIDNGIGVPANERHHLFTKFYRAKNAQKARPDGTGLGLYMAKKVIVTQGGSIIFSSEENKGSTFGFSLPLAKLAVPSSGNPKPDQQPTTRN